LVEDLDSHRGSCVEAARGVDAQATYASAIGVVGQVEVEIGLLKAGNSIAAYLETRDELTAAVGDVEQGLVRGQAEGRRHLEPGEGVVLKATGGRLVRHFALCGVEAVGVSVLSSHGGGGEGREPGLQPPRFGSTQDNAVGVFQSLESL
jgi:hypothetical protein